MILQPNQYPNQRNSNGTCLGHLHGPGEFQKWIKSCRKWMWEKNTKANVPRIPKVCKPWARSNTITKHITRCRPQWSCCIWTSKYVACRPCNLRRYNGKPLNARYTTDHTTSHARRHFVGSSNRGGKGTKARSITLFPLDIQLQVESCLGKAFCTL